MRYLQRVNQNKLKLKKVSVMRQKQNWNAVDGQDGGNDYYRGTCWYVKTFAKPEIEDGEEVWLELEGAAMTSEVYLNGEKLMHHEGGYSAFRVNLTEHLKEKNELVVSRRVQQRWRISLRWK